MADLPDVVQRYLGAYNALDVDGMLACLADDIRFRNIQDGEINVDVIGPGAFERLARESAAAFRERAQEISGMIVAGPHVAFKVRFEGILAKPLGEGLEAGQILQIQGQSYIRVEQGLITEIVDAS